MAEKFQPVSSDLTLKERKEARSLRSVDLSDDEIGNRRYPGNQLCFPSSFYIQLCLVHTVPSSDTICFTESCLFFVCFCCPANVNIFGEIIFSASVDLACAITSNPSCLESTTSDEHEEYFTKPRMAPCHLVIIFATHNLVGSSTATDSRSHNDLFDATFPHQELNKPQKVLNNMKPTKSQLLMSLTDLTLDSRRRSSQARFSQRLGLLEFVDIISCGIHIASVLGFGVKVEIIQGSLKELSGDVMCWNDYVINRILNYFHVGNKIYETSIHSIGFGVKVEIIQSSLKELSGDDMCWNDYVSIM
ncbi:hypothetical protein GQR58_008490 [Nymphon striatum]|nr:hypothetical protein GQR58_008490 [Nymphon striatum]